MQVFRHKDKANSKLWVAAPYSFITIPEGISVHCRPYHRIDDNDKIVWINPEDLEEICLNEELQNRHKKDNNNASIHKRDIVKIKKAVQEAVEGIIKTWEAANDIENLIGVEPDKLLTELDLLAVDHTQGGLISDVALVNFLTNLGVPVSEELDNPNS